MSSKKGLGRGLEHLFEQTNGIMEETDNEKFVNISLKEIKPNPYQPRENFDEKELKELADSIKENGLFQPILVRKTLIGYEIISGERRFRASKIAQLSTIPAIVYEYTDNQMMEVALVENIQRSDLSVLEEARSYAKLMENLGYKQEELATKIGKSRSHVANLLRLLTLDKEILNSLEKNEISKGHAKVLLSVKDEKKRIELLHKIKEESWSVRDLENNLKNTSKEKEKISHSTVTKKNKISEYSRLEKIMIEKLGTKVLITGKDKGQIKIEYLSEEDLERLLEILNII